MVAEAVEDALALRVLRDEGVVVGLVEVEAGFLSAGKVEAELHAGQGDFEGGGG